jgi:hypothetical protein
MTGDYDLMGLPALGHYGNRLVGDVTKDSLAFSARRRSRVSTLPAAATWIGCWT